MLFDVTTMSRTSLDTPYSNLYSYWRYVFLLHKAMLHWFYLSLQTVYCFHIFIHK